MEEIIYFIDEKGRPRRGELRVLSPMGKKIVKLENGRRKHLDREEEISNLEYKMRKMSSRMRREDSDLG